MASYEDRKLTEVDLKIKTSQKAFDEIFPIWNVVDRKIKSLQAEIRRLEDEKFRLTQGQLVFDDTLDF